jgi:hypothetical protein
MKRLFFSILAVVYVSITAQSATILHVDNAGSDVNIGSNVLPLKNIQTAINLANNGDTILINRGQYFEKINLLTKNIIITSNYIFTLDTLDIQNTIIDGNNEVGTLFYVGGGQDSKTKVIGLTIQNGVSPSNGGSAFTFSNTGNGYGSSAAIIENCVIKNNKGSAISSSYCGSDLFWTANGDKILIKNTKFTNNISTSIGACIICFVSDIQIQSCLFENNNGTEGSAIYSWRSQPTIMNSIFYGQSKSIVLRGDVAPSAQPKLISNTFFDNGYSVEGLGDVIIYAMNNIFYGQGIPSLYMQNQSFYESNNLYRDNNCLDISGFSYTNSIFGNPLFTNTMLSDFSLNSNSPAINKGTINVTLNGIVITSPLLDYYGNLRPNQVGTNPNIGAIQTGKGITTFLSKLNLDERIHMTNKIIKISNALGKSIIIFDISGRKIFETIKAEETEEINVNNIGVFIISIDNFKRKVIVY